MSTLKISEAEVDKLSATHELSQKDGRDMARRLLGSGHWPNKHVFLTTLQNDMWVAQKKASGAKRVPYEGGSLRDGSTGILSMLWRGGNRGKFLDDDAREAAHDREAEARPSRRSGREEQRQDDAAYLASYSEPAVHAAPASVPARRGRTAAQIHQDLKDLEIYYHGHKERLFEELRQAGSGA